MGDVMPSLLFWRWVVAVAAMLLCCLAACTAAQEGPSPQLSPASQVPPDYRALGRELERRITEGQPELQHVRAVLVSVDNRTVVEHYRQSKASEYAHVYSVTKSVTSILVGIALDEGHLKSLDQTLGQSLPQYRSKMTKQTAAITVRQLLTHTSGVPGNSTSGPDLSMLVADDGVGRIVSSTLLNEPGTLFDYSNPGSHLVAAILAEATGRPVLDYAREKLFDPLGIKTEPAYEGPAYEGPTQAGLDYAGLTRDFQQAGFAWGTDRQGIHTGCCFLRLTAPDMIKIGELYLYEGTWRGRKIVSADWVRDSTTSHVTPEQVGPEGGYGYFWWLHALRGHPIYFASGSFGQAVIVVPDLQTVIAVSTRDGRDSDKIDLIPLVDAVVAEVE